MCLCLTINILGDLKATKCRTVYFTDIINIHRKRYGLRDIDSDIDIVSIKMSFKISGTSQVGLWGLREAIVHMA